MPGKIKKVITILIIPQNTKRTVSIEVSRNNLISFILFGVLFFSAFSVLIYYAGAISLRLQLVSSLQNENKRLVAENKKIVDLSQRIQSLETTREYFKRLAIQNYSQKTTRVTPALKKNSTEENNKINNQYSLRFIPAIAPLCTKVKKLQSEDSNKIGYTIIHQTPIIATAHGTVLPIHCNDKGEYEIEIKHAHGYKTRYTGCSQVFVRQGTEVFRGETIGVADNSNYKSSGIFYYEIEKDGIRKNPLYFMIDNTKIL